MIHCKRVSFKAFSGALGQLNAIEGGGDIPFDIRRVYYITGVPGNVTRGYHSHRHLEQVLLCPHGSVKIRLKAPGEADEVVSLDDPSTGLYIGHMVWREMFDFTPGTVLLVLASKHYDESDYMRDYDRYVQEAVPYFEAVRSEK